MNQFEVITLFNSLEDLPSFYDHAPLGTQIPFLVLHVTQPDNFAADDQVYVENWHFRVDLYCREKNPSLERQVKDLLNGAGIFWKRDENYLTDESVYEIEFDFDVYGNEPEPTPEPTPEPDGGENDGNTP